MSEMTTAPKKATEMIMTIGIADGLPAGSFLRGDVFEMPGVPDVLFGFAGAEPYPKMPGWVKVQLLNEEEVPFLMKEDELLIPRRMMRRWRPECMLCREPGEVVLDMVERGRVTGRICAPCSG